MTRRGWVRVETDVVTSPDGRRMVLIQLPDGHVLVTAEDARTIAGMIESTAYELEVES